MRVRARRVMVKARVVKLSGAKAVGAAQAHLRYLQRDGTTRDGDLYRRIGTVWKFVITEKSVDDYLSRRPQK